MPLPVAIETLLLNARQEILVSQVISGIIGVLLGPGCLILSFVPEDASPGYRTTLRIGGAIVFALLIGLVFETRRRLTRANRLIEVLRSETDQVTTVVPYKQKGGVMGNYRILVQLKDGTSENLPVAEADYNTLLSYFRSKYPNAVREQREERIRG